MERHLQSINQTVHTSLETCVMHVRADQDELELLLVGMVDVVSRVASPGALRLSSTISHTQRLSGPRGTAALAPLGGAAPGAGQPPERTSWARSFRGRWSKP